MSDDYDAGVEEAFGRAGHEAPGVRASSEAVGRAVVGLIPVKVQAVLGAARMTVAQLNAMKCGGIVELDRRIGEAVEVLVNGHPIGRGEIVVVEDPSPRFAVRMTEVFGKNASADA